MYERDEWHSPLATPLSLGVFVIAGGTRSPVGSRLSGLRQALSRRTMAAVGRQRSAGWTSSRPPLEAPTMS